MTALRSLLVAVLLGAFVSAAHASGASGPAAAAAPVPSLEPAKTAAMWRSLVAQQPKPAQAQAQARAQAECRPLRAVFYAASDWMRLATKLAAARSSCAEYYISVPPLVADKTQFRPDQAWRIRALGPEFHAMAEVHFATWTRWVASTGNSWFTAGVTAREHMAAAGYDVAQGDTWALNELTTAVRRGDGNARANVREFLRGLYQGDGSRPTRGAALVIGFGQRTGDLTAYQNTLQNWLADTSFWTDMATYVSDWSQEVYGDLRAHAVPGEPVLTRRDYLDDYLEHPLVLANAGPAAIDPARSFLQAAYSPLANGAWPRETAWGWTMVPVDQMSAYISAQVDAMRSYTAATGQARDHWGFAWAPSNTTGMPAGDFATQTGQLLDRLATAIRDSAEAADPATETGACGPPGQDTLCRGRHSGRDPQRGLAVVPHVDTAAAGDRAGGPIRDRGRSFRALDGVADDECRDPGHERAGLRRHAPVELDGRHVRRKRGRTLDADPCALRRAGRLGHLLLPRHARRHGDGDRVRSGRDGGYAVRHRGRGSSGARHARAHVARAPRPHHWHVRRGGGGRLRERDRGDPLLERCSADARHDRDVGRHGHIHGRPRRTSRNRDRVRGIDADRTSHGARAFPRRCTWGRWSPSAPAAGSGWSSAPSTARAGRSREPT